MRTARDRMTNQSFPISAREGGSNSAWISSSSWRDGLSFKHKLRFPDMQAPGKPALHAHNWIDGDGS
jgi:hypothetical protein